MCMLIAETYLVNCSFKESDFELIFQYFIPGTVIKSKQITELHMDGKDEINNLFLHFNYEPLKSQGRFKHSSFFIHVAAKIHDIAKKVGFHRNKNSTTTEPETTIVERYKRDHGLFSNYLQKNKKNNSDLVHAHAVANWIKDEIWNGYTQEDKNKHSNIKKIKKGGLFFGMIGAKEVVIYEQDPDWARDIVSVYEMLAPVFKCVFETQERLPPKPVATAPPVATTPLKAAATTAAMPPQPVAPAPLKAAATTAAIPPQPVPPVVLDPKYNMLQSALVSDLQRVVSDAAVVRAAEESEKAIATANVKNAAEKLIKLDNYVKSRALAKKITIDPIEQLDIVSKLVATDGPFPFDNPSNYQRMTTSGNDLDCLIHSLLISCSETFRKIQLPGRNKIASEFRRSEMTDANGIETMLTLYKRLRRQSTNTPTYNTEFDAQINDLKSVNTLDTHIAGQFGEEYGIGVLIRDVGVWRWMGSDNFGVPFIILYNPGNGHYESVSRVDASSGGTKNEYLFSRKEIKTWETEVLRGSTSKQLLSSCNVGVAESVQFKTPSTFSKVIIGSMISPDNNVNNYIVVHTKIGETGCERFYVIKYDNDKYNENPAAYQKQFGELVAEIQGRIQTDEPFTGLPNIYNISHDDSKKYKASTYALAGGSRIVKQKHKRNGKKTVKRSTASYK